MILVNKDRRLSFRLSSQEHYFSSASVPKTQTGDVGETSPPALGLRLCPLADDGRGILAGLSGCRRKKKHGKEKDEIQRMAPMSSLVKPLEIHIIIIMLWVFALE